VNKALLDTDTLSEIGKGKHPAIASNAKTYRKAFGHYLFSTVTVLEIIRGYQKAQDLRRMNAFIASVASEVIFLLDLSAAKLAGRITGALDRIGQPIGRADPMIAAIAIDQGLELVTGNTAHYQRIQTLGYPLRLVSWRIGAKAHHRSAGFRWTYGESPVRPALQTFTSRATRLMAGVSAIRLT
jgi:tRNA(fMet)-specific endonuclease VapC